MRCKDIENKLSAFQDRQLPPEEVSAVRVHLKNCPKCKQHLAEMEELWQFLGNVEQFDSAPFFWSKLDRKINQTTGNQKRFFRGDFFPRFSPAPIIALLLLIFSLWTGFYLGKTLFFYATPAKEMTSEIDSESLLAINSVDDFTGESVSDIYQTLLSDDNK